MTTRVTNLEAYAEVETREIGTRRLYKCCDCGITAQFSDKCFLCGNRLTAFETKVIKETLSDILSPEQCQKFKVDGYGGEYVNNHPNLILTLNSWAFKEPPIMQRIDSDYHFDFDGVAAIDLDKARKCVERFEEIFAEELAALRARAVSVKIQFGVIWYDA